MAIKSVQKSFVELEKHIITNIVLPRIRSLPDSESYKGEAEDFYLKLLSNQDELETISSKTCGLIYRTFSGYSSDVVDDVMGDIVSATIQDQTNEYRKVKKSTHGFWRDRFDLNPKTSSFSVSFSNVCFRAMQTAAKMIETRKKHEQNDFLISAEGKDEHYFTECIPDTRDTLTKFENMTGYDDVIRKMYDHIMSCPGLDTTAKLIFKVWFDKKEERLDFSASVRMSSEVYPAVSQLLEHNGEKAMGMTSYHLRWKEVLKEIKLFFA